MKFILRIISTGFELIADGYTQPRQYTYPEKDGFVRDHSRLTGDVRRVGVDIKKAINSRDKQTNKAASYTP